VVSLAPPGSDTSTMVTFEGTIEAADIVNPACGATVEDLLASFVAGEAYVNVHSDENGTGEVRGQIDTLVVFWPSLTGAAEVPAVTTTVSGTATFALNPSSSAIDYYLDLVNPDAIGIFGGPGAHIHCGGPCVLLVLDDVSAHEEMLILIQLHRIFSTTVVTSAENGPVVVFLAPGEMDSVVAP